MKAWHTIQSGIEQLDPQCWVEIVRQSLFGNIYLTNKMGVQWGTEAKSNMIRWANRGIHSLKMLTREEGEGWRTFDEVPSLKRCWLAPPLHRRLVAIIPWEATQPPPHTMGQWLARKDEDVKIRTIYQLIDTNPSRANVYTRADTEQLQLRDTQHPLPEGHLHEVRTIRCGGEKRTVMEFNPKGRIGAYSSVWLWGNEWICNLEWDPKEWQWRRVGILLETTVLNYTTKRGYRIALRQNNHTIRVDAELAANGVNSKARAKFFNRIWHPYLPRQVSAMQWLILTEGLPVRAWRERIGLPHACQICPNPVRETLQHAFLECPAINQAWELFRKTPSLS